MSMSLLRRVLLIVLTMISSGFCTGQLKYGLSSGLNLARNSGSTPVSMDHKVKTGFGVGSVIVLPILENQLDVRLESGYSTLNILDAGEDQNINFTIKSKLGYWNTSLLAGVNPLTRVSIIAGINYGNLLNVKNRFERQSWEVENNSRNLFHDNLSGVFGIEIALNKYLSPGVRYFHGLNDIGPNTLRLSGYEINTLNRIRSLKFYLIYFLNGSE